MLHCQHNTFPDPTCNLRGFVHDFLKAFSKSHSSLQHYHRNSSPSLSCNFRDFVLHCQHNSFLDPSCNFRGFLHDFSPGLSCSCHGFELHFQHSSSLNLLDNLPFRQLSSNCLPHNTNPHILHALTLILSHVFTLFKIT